MEIDASEEKVTIDFSNPPLSYSYDENGIFTQTETCSPDPLESEIKGEAVWLIPVNATLIEPPTAVEKHIRVFKNGAWAQVEDNRSTKYWLPGDTWSSEPREMKGLGPLPEGAVTVQPEKSEKEKQLEAYQTELREKEAWLASKDYIGVKIATGRATVDAYAAEIATMTEYAARVEELRMLIERLK